MGNLVSDQQIINAVDRTTPISALLDLDEADILSVGINVSAATGSNLIDFEESVDGINFVSVVSLIITEPGTTIWHIHPVYSRFKKISYTPSSGSATFTVHVNIRNFGMQYDNNTPTITMGI